MPRPKISRLAIYRILFGALAAIPLGYFLEAIGSGTEGAMGIKFWLYWFPGSALAWAIYGAAMGALWHSISQLAKN
jgi:hypothetical protein